MKKTEQINVPEIAWPVTFEQIEDAQLREMLKATPAQRLAMAEELFLIAIAAKSAKAVKSDR